MGANTYGDEFARQEDHMEDSSGTGEVPPNGPNIVIIWSRFLTYILDKNGPFASKSKTATLPILTKPAMKYSPNGHPSGQDSLYIPRGGIVGGLSSPLPCIFATTAPLSNLFRFLVSIYVTRFVT